MSKLKIKQISAVSSLEYATLISNGTNVKWSNELTSGMLIPNGTTGSRPSSGTGGHLRFNTTLQSFEGHNGYSWNTLLTGITLSEDSIVQGTGITELNFTGSVSTSILDNIATINVSSSGSSSYPVNNQTNTTYNIISGDNGKLLTFKNASNISVTLPASGVSFPDGWHVDVMNRGTSTEGAVTITSTSQIDDSTVLYLPPGKGTRIYSSGTSYYTNRTRGPHLYQFRINFDSVPNVATTNFFTNAPAGWSCTRDGIAAVTITHNQGKPFSLVHAMGFNGTTYTQRFPNTSSGGSTFAAASTSSNNNLVLTGLTLTNTSVTANQHIIFTVMFTE